MMGLPWRQGHPHSVGPMEWAVACDGAALEMMGWNGMAGMPWALWACPPFPHSCHGPSGAWRTAAMVCAVDPLTSPVCVTWAGHRTCPRPRLPRGPPAPAAPETVAATSTAIAESGGLASAMSARVSCPPPRHPWTGLQGASSGFQFSFLCVGFSVPSPSSGSSCPLPAPDP